MAPPKSSAGPPASPPASPSAARVGVWLIGARGSIATTVAYGLAGLRAGWIEPLGLATECEPVGRLDLVPFEGLVIAGHEVRRGDLGASAAALQRERILSPDLVAASSAEVASYDARIRPGLLDAPDVGLADLHPKAAQLGAAPPREQIAALRDDFETFAREHELDDVVVVNLASTEAQSEFRGEWRSLQAFEEALDEGRGQPASLVYAYAAFRSGFPFVNFTPNRGATPPALRELAQERGVPHCGNDGKTGETLVKTVIAPMFRARALRVLSWQGYNMLGNRDGEVLNDPVHREAKVHNKDEALRAILGDPAVHSKVGIDYVPSLGDWKTAWDFVHFEGFLGTRMSLQLTWQGCDSALAAPLVLDLVRLAHLASHRGEAGVMEHTACFFKAPLGGGTHDFHAQFARLRSYAERSAPPGAPGPSK